MPDTHDATRTADGSRMRGCQGFTGWTRAPRCGRPLGRASAPANVALGFEVLLSVEAAMQQWHTFPPSESTAGRAGSAASECAMDCARLVGCFPLSTALQSAATGASQHSRDGGAVARIRDARSRGGKTRRRFPVPGGRLRQFAADPAARRLEAILVLAAIIAFVVKTGRRDALPYIQGAAGDSGHWRCWC